MDTNSSFVACPFVILSVALFGCKVVPIVENKYVGKIFSTNTQTHTDTHTHTHTKQNNNKTKKKKKKKNNNIVDLHKVKA